MFMDEDDKLLDVAVRESAYLYNHGLFDASLVIRELLKQRNNMLEALKEAKEAKDALEHMWREVSMNEYDYEKLNEAIINSDSAITKAEEVE